MKCARFQCVNVVSQARLDTGTRLCIECGAKAAAEETAAKSKRVGIAFNKGAVQYLGDPEVAKRTMMDAGRKDPNLNGVASTTPRVSLVRVEAKKTQTPLRKVIGFVIRKRNVYPWGTERVLIHEGDKKPDDMIAL